MSGTEGFAATGLILLNRHIRITEADDLLLATLTSLHNKLFAAARSSLRLVAGHFGFISARCHHRCPHPGYAQKRE